MPLRIQVHATIRIDNRKLWQALDKRYEAYAMSVGAQLRAAAITIFESQDVKGNEWRTSETTPPKYISSFRTRYTRATKIMRFSNEDPAWHLVEWGAHPGGNPDTFVLRYKPLTRALIMVGTVR